MKKVIIELDVKTDEEVHKMIEKIVASPKCISFEIRSE